MRRAPVLRRAYGLLLLLVPALLALPARAAGEGVVERWYENLHRGQKTGWTHVVWTPSTWEGKPTVHDRTTVFSHTVRDMLGIRDDFRTASTVDIERGEDGLLWWQKSESTEAGRVITDEITWTGAAYEVVSRVDETENRVTVPAAERVPVDAEAFLVEAVRAKRLTKGQRLSMPVLDVRARALRTNDVEILGTESVEGEAGEVPCTKVRQSDAQAGFATLLWLDAEGGVVQVKDDGGGLIRRRSREVAEKTPESVAVSPITTDSVPTLERIFSADRVLLDLRLRADPDRGAPEYPDSPWSRVLGRTGSDAEGWVYRVELRKYDSDAVAGTLPVDAAAFARDLEPTPMMQVGHERVRAKARELAGEEKDIRKAAHAIVRWVFESLQKQSLEVAEGSALEILEKCQGDCSEHARLFVTLCRAAGIPARICSGFVSVGSDWGAHSWAEVWTGQWISADPSTGELGGAARYLFFGYPDRPGSYPGVVSSRSQARMGFHIVRVEEGDQSWELSADESTWFVREPESGRFLHVLLGLEARDVPEGWTVRLSATGVPLWLQGPGVTAAIRAHADQGYTLDAYQSMGRSVVFGGAEGRVQASDDHSWTYFLSSRRRIVRLDIQVEDLETLTLLEEILAPTFAPRPLAWQPLAPTLPKDD